MKMYLSSSGTETIPFFRRAVEIDPNFGIAHAQLGTDLSASRESVPAGESGRKAWLLRERVSDRERFYIDFTYDRHGTGNLEKAYQTLELWAQTYPRRGGGNADPRGLLAGISSQGTGRFQTAIEILQERIAGEPNQASAYGLLASAYLRTDRFAEVESTLQRAFERKLETPTILVNRYNIAVLQGDQDEMNRVASQATGKPKSDHWVPHQE